MSDAKVTEPGVYEMPDDVYHADPVPGGSLSVSHAKSLLPPKCPAVFAYEREHRPEPSPEFTFGHAAHKLVLGSGPEIVVIDADSFRTKDAKAERDAALDAGKIPLLPPDMETVTDMAAALRAHPVASLLFSPERGLPEQSLFWVDEPSGVWRRCRLDWLPHPTSGRMIVPDYKTAQSADPTRFAKSAADYGYHMQAAWYLDAVLTLGLAGDAAFVFVVQEKTPPYLVSVVELDAVALRIGDRLNRSAIETYAACAAADEWPGYSSDVELVSLPGWYVRQNDDGEGPW